MPPVLEHERALVLPQYEVIVLAGREIRLGLDAQFAAHPEMHAKPEAGLVFLPDAVCVLEMKHHLLAVRLRAPEHPAPQQAAQTLRVRAAKHADSRPGYEHFMDRRAEPDVPLTARVIDLGEFGHGEAKG